MTPDATADEAGEGDESVYDQTTEWEGFSHYETVSRNISKSISDAMDAYAWLQGAHKEGASVRPDLAADARADILSAAMRLHVEMRQERAQGNSTYDEILERWDGDEGGGNGYIARFHGVRVTEEVPSWMLQFVSDIRTAGWLLGYLQAGRRSKKQAGGPVESETEAMFEGL